LFDLRYITILFYDIIITIDPLQNAAKLVTALQTLKLKNIFSIHLTEHTHKITIKVTIKLIINYQKMQLSEVTVIDEKKGTKLNY